MEMHAQMQFFFVWTTCEVLDAAHAHARCREQAINRIPCAYTECHLLSQSHCSSFLTLSIYAFPFIDPIRYC